MTCKFDIPINISILAKDEAEAERVVLAYLRTAGKVIDCPELIDYELFEFVSNDLSQSCCC